MFDWDWAVLVVDATSPMFTRSMVEAVNARGRFVLAVWDEKEPAGKDRALRAGVTTLIEENADPSEFLAIVGPLETDRPAITIPTRRRPVEVETRRGGLVVAVGGPTSDSAATAVALASIFAQRGYRTVVVDANEVAPQTAQRLSLLPLPNLATAVQSGEADVSSLCQAVPDGGFWVLAGLADPGQWRDVAARAAADVLAGLGRFFDVVVAVAGPVLEDLRRSGVDRFGLSRVAIATADVLVAVAPGSPVGVVALARWMDEARRCVTTLDPSVHLVAVDAPAGRTQRGQLADTLATLNEMRAQSVTVVAATSRRDAWNGTVPKGRALRRSMAHLADEIGVSK
jgi:Mrp family chromosome partitioning ATPase